MTCLSHYPEVENTSSWCYMDDMQVYMWQLASNDWNFWQSTASGNSLVLFVVFRVCFFVVVVFKDLITARGAWVILLSSHIYPLYYIERRNVWQIARYVNKKHITASRWNICEWNSKINIIPQNLSIAFPRQEQCANEKGVYSDVKVKDSSKFQHDMKVFSFTGFLQVFLV